MVDSSTRVYARVVLSHAIPAVAAIVAALSVFGGLVSAGAWLVRRLRLPSDLPDGCRFEPRPPAVGSAEDALGRAAAWERRQRACAAAEASYRDAVRIHEILAEIAHPDRPTGEHDRAALVAELQPVAQEAETTTDQATAAMHDEDLDAAIERCESAAARVAALRETAEARLSALPPLPRSYRNLILLAVLLVVVLLWLVIGLPLLQQGLAP